MYLRNAWYMAGWAKDFLPGEPKAEEILGEPIVIFRADNGTVAALADRCVHRLAPLSLGRCEGANLRCMYHGLLFAPDGRCIEIPAQATVPPTARVRAYPVVEKDSAVWIWMGAPAAASLELLPDFKGHKHPDWAMTPGQIDYKAPARLINDNLLDLSHVAYVHRNSFGGGNANVGRGWVQADMNVRTLPRGVLVERWMENMPSTPAGGSRVLGDQGPGDAFTYYQFLVPGVFLQFAGRYPAGTYRRVNGQKPDVEPIFSIFTCQAVTPLTDDTARYFFAQGPSSRFASEKEFFYDLGLMAFEEDRCMIEAQYKIIQADPSVRMMPMAMDKSVKKYEGVVKRLMELEGPAA